MYTHDIYYAYPGGNPGSSSNVKNSWIHFRKDGYDGLYGKDYEWLITRSATYNDDKFRNVFAVAISYDGHVSKNGLNIDVAI